MSTRTIQCDRCRRIAKPSDNPDMDLCIPCCAHLRAGGAWDLSSPTPGKLPAGANCPRWLAPFRASIVYGPVPSHPSDSDFHMAATDKFHNPWDPAAQWRFEAIRARRQNPGCALTT